MYKLVAIDLDGTLLDNTGKISLENKEAIKRARKKGVKIILTTGRALSSTKAICIECGLNDYFISGNGSLLYDLSKNEIIYDNCISKEKTLEIAKLCEENSIFYAVTTTNFILSKSLNYNIMSYHFENSRKPENLKTNLNIIENMYDYIKNIGGIKYFKISVCDSDKNIFNRIIEKLKKIKQIEVLDVAHESVKTIENGTEKVKIEYYYTEITNAGVNKWLALEKLTQELNIDPSEVIAIGDNINDKSMIVNAGLGVAMGNSAPYIKEFSDIVTDSNSQNGVAKILNTYIS